MTERNRPIQLGFGLIEFAFVIEHHSQVRQCFELIRICRNQLPHFLFRFCRLATEQQHASVHPVGLRGRIQCDNSTPRLLSKFIQTCVAIRIPQRLPSDCAVWCHADRLLCGTDRISLLTALAVSERQSDQSF